MDDQQGPAPYAPTPQLSVPAPKSRSKAMPVVAVIAALLIAYAAYAFVTDSPPFGPSEPIASELPSPLPTETPDPTAGWRSYTNASTGFSFRYPVGMSFSETERENPGDPLKRWVEIVGEGVGLQMGVAINNPGRGLNEIADPVLGTVIADGVTIAYQAGRIQTEFLWRAQFSVSGDYYIVEFLSPDGVDRTELVRNILSTFRFTK